jgi:hypothetical protein
MSADAETLYAIIQNNPVLSDPVSFTVLALDARAMTTLTLSGPASGTAHGSVTLTGQLTTQLTGTQAALPGAKVTITRTISGAGTKATETLSATTAADGTFTVTDPLPVNGTYTYTASFARGLREHARRARRSHHRRPTWPMKGSRPRA